jgi:predicted amidohydrolase YtcJ
MATLFTGGALFDGYRHLGAGTALVVDDGRIVEVGAEDALSTAPGPGVEVVDLGGGLLTPGFVDAHVHAVQGGLERIRCDLSQVSGRGNYLDAIGAYAAAHPDVPWILGGGWAMATFPGGTPTAAELDRVVSDRPVYLPNRDHHGAWVNTRALELAGVDATTPDPPHGRIERDAEGAPAGTLHEGAMQLVARHAPADDPDDYYRGLLEGQRYLHSLGVTGWQDAIIGDYAGMQDPGPAYLAAARQGDLTAYVVGALWWERDLGEEQVESLIERRERYTHGRFRATSVKIMQDGVAENFTAAMTAPYLDADGRPTANSGHSFVNPVALRHYVARLSEEGFQVHVHAIGDRAVREALDAFAAARKANGETGNRHHIAHLQVVHPDDVPRFGVLGVAANMQPLWATYEPQMVDLTIPVLGAERTTWQYPFRGLWRTGAPLAAGSDWPVSSPDPLAGIHVAVNRRTPRSVGVPEERAFLPEQALDLPTAMAAYTQGSAYVNHLDDGGRIEAGALADLAVLDRDPFAAPAEDIGDARVVATFVEGAEVFSR